MKKTILADTSLLVAAMVDSHPAHQRALPWLQRAKRAEISLFVAAHTLADLYAVLTRLPISPRISPDLARRLVRNNVESLATVVALDAADYRTVLDELTEQGLCGGVVYDALAVQAARKVGVDQILTLNEADFRRVWSNAGDRIASP